MISKNNKDGPRGRAEREREGKKLELQCITCCHGSGSGASRAHVLVKYLFVGAHVARDAHELSTRKLRLEESHHSQTTLI